MKKILITGGSGLVGKNLSALFTEKGYVVEHLSRSKNEDALYKTWQWNPGEFWIEEGALNDSFAIIHLAGANIGSTPFSEKGKKLLYDSRIKTAELLYNEAQKGGQFPEAYISASAIGFYGMKTTDHIFSENDPAGDDFVAELSREWENSADQFKGVSRVIKIRIGLVLDKNEGVLSKLALPIKFGLGAAFGNGKQWMPWVHLKDLCSIFYTVLQNEHTGGVYNAVAPEHIAHKPFLQTVANALNRPFWLPNIPPFIIRLITGEKADLVLEGSRVSSRKLLESGFNFSFPSLKDALSDIYH